MQVSHTKFENQIFQKNQKETLPTKKSLWYKQIYLEFHGGKLIEDLPHVLTDNRPCDFIVTLGSGFNSSAGHIIKCNHVGQHSHCLVEWAEPRINESQNNKTENRKQVHTFYFTCEIPEHCFLYLDMHTTYIYGMILKE